MAENGEWPKFKMGEKAGELLLDWWKELDVHRGDRADLRRTAKPVEVMFNPAYHRLRFRLLSSGYAKTSDEKLALVVGLAARVKKPDAPRLVAQQMGELKGKKPLVNELRFRRILETDKPEELFPILIRVLPLLGNSLNLLDLADSIYRWNEKNNDKRKRWALEYYSMLPEKAAKS